jgi:hypothetical protein
LSIYERAVKIEQELREVVKAMDTPGNTAMEIMLCLRPSDPESVRVEKRREKAAGLFKVTADTFHRRKRHEPMLVLDLALRLCQRRMQA